MDRHVVDVRGVDYRYGRRTVLSDVSLSLGFGVTALLGPNGAGKSTLLEILATLRRPHCGSVRIEDSLAPGAALLSARRNVGYLPQKFNLMGNRTAQQNAACAAWIHGVHASKCNATALTALRTVDLETLADRRIRSLSGGQRQRVGIACATAHDPSLVLLDEPTVGLDPRQRQTLCDLIVAMGTQRTVLVSTHLVEDLPRMASDAVVLDNGRVIFSGTVSQLAAVSPDVDMPLGARIEAGYSTLLGEDP